MNYEEMLKLLVREGPNMITVADWFNRMGSDEFDFEHYKTCGMLEQIVHLSENHLLHNAPEDAMCSETLAYWENLGLKKAFYEDPAGDFVVFTPLSMDAPENAGRKYPLVFTICGDNGDLYMVETLSFTHLAAEEEFIQVIPQLVRPGQPMDRDRPYLLLQKLKEMFPVDETRVYMSGFSHGGILSQWNCIAHYEVFAGACAAGIRPGDGAPKRVFPSFMVKYNYPVTDEVAKCKVPIVYCIGAAEQPQHIPLYKENHTPHFEHYIDEHVDLLRYITRMNETAEITEEILLQCEHSEDASERAIGLPLINTHHEPYYGAMHYFGDVPSADGVVRTRYIGVENQPHHPSAAWARLSWDFIKKFRRDPVTHASYIVED